MYIACGSLSHSWATDSNSSNIIFSIILWHCSLLIRPLVGSLKEANKRLTNLGCGAWNLYVYQIKKKPEQYNQFYCLYY